ncbi:aminoglycoside phosphotransferase family protein [Streptosporangium sp. G11]|uniref:aminoglycoside phosphotransferase family protein n=1 Tax=Streptosporangium sp. G11 TaxID=3436926 RepID=UPI003EBDDAF3
MRAQPPTALLSQLRAAHATGSDHGARAATQWGMRPLSGGRNNLVYGWRDPSSGTEICIKLYKIDERRRAEREWHALTSVAGTGIEEVPAPVWYDPAGPYPAIAMTLLPGEPLPATHLPEPTPALKALAALHGRLTEVPLTGLLAELPRIDSAPHYINRLTRLWPDQLADAADEPLTADMLTLLRRWEESGDRELLLNPAPAVFSRGDSNLLNWLWDGGEIRCVDFEFTGYSDTAFDAADLCEHISARDIDDEVWESLHADLGITAALTPRFRAAQRTCALRWLAVLWRQRFTREPEFATQRERAHRLLRTIGS